MIERGGFELDDDFARASLRVGHFFEDQLVGAAQFSQDDCFHFSARFLEWEIEDLKITIGLRASLLPRSHQFHVLRQLRDNLIEKLYAFEVRLFADALIVAVYAAA